MRGYFSWRLPYILNMYNMDNILSIVIGVMFPNVQYLNFSRLNSTLIELLSFAETQEQ
jgi:hypothetical protein